MRFLSQLSCVKLSDDEVDVIEADEEEGEHIAPPLSDLSDS